MSSVVTPITLLNQKVFLNNVGYHDTIQKAFAFACSRDYHITGDIPVELQVEAVDTLAVAYDKIVYLYDEDTTEVTKYNGLGGVGYIILYKDGNEIYSVVSVEDERRRHITMFSPYHPLIEHFNRVTSSL